jgi:hypothetical protein
MPATFWSAPTQEGNPTPFVQSTITAAVLDVSPGQYLIPAGMLDVGTRLRISAWGQYIATTTASTITWGFYMGNVGGTILTPPVTLTLGPAVTCVATTMPWELEYKGTISAASVSANATTGQIIGRGRFFSPITSWITAGNWLITPQSAANQTVQQTANGMNTATTQNIFVGATVTTATGLTSITTNELTCEILG